MAAAGLDPRRGVPEKRWGLRTLAYLTLAAGCVITSNVLVTFGDPGYVLLLTLAGTLVGLVGAAVCSVKGLRAWKGFRL